MAFAAVQPIAAVDGSLLTIDAVAVDGAVSFTSRVSIPSISARPQFGSADWIRRAAQKTGLSMEGSLSGYLSETIWAALWTKLTAGNAVALTLQDETGAGKAIYSGNFILTEVSKSNPADGYIEFTCNFQSAAVITKTPQIVLTPAAGALTAGQVSVAYSATTFAATGGNAPYAFSLEGGNEIFPGAALDPATGAVTGTPPAGSAGTYRSKVRVTDDDGVYVIQEYTIVIAP